MNEADRTRAAEYALGLLAAGERIGFARAAETDPTLAGWDDAFAPLHASAEVAAPPDMFARIQTAIASRSRLLPGTLTVRAA